MIRRPTVLILGAGASIPFGFPSGFALLQELVTDMFRHRMVQAGFDADEVFGFQQALARSGRRSVDAFLEHRPEFLEIGKLAIALALIPHESDGLFDRSKEPHLYDHIFHHLSAPFNQLGGNQLAVLTFNYDRSFEAFLHAAILNSYGKSPLETASVMANIPVIHLHGQLGSLDDRPYSPELTHVREAASAIRVIHEGTKGQPQFEIAREALSRASRVYFVGFGYDATNLARLTIKEVPSDAELFGSAFGLTAQERFMITGLFGRKIALSDEHHDGLAFLRSSPSLS